MNRNRLESVGENPLWFRLVFISLHLNDSPTVRNRKLEHCMLRRKNKIKNKQQHWKPNLVVIEFWAFHKYKLLINVQFLALFKILKFLLLNIGHRFRNFPMRILYTQSKTLLIFFITTGESVKNKNFLDNNKWHGSAEVRIL